ncbi:MAG: YkgJ family cysteine cluster protein [Planctomycetaceae bacterium]
MDGGANLPLIENCDRCGACCMRTPVPPFAPGEEAARNVPDSLLQTIQQRIDADQHFDLIPCVWFDPDLRRCRNYEYRPDACRAFEIGSTLCRLSRWDEGIDK